MAKRSDRARLLQGLEAQICPPVGVSARQWRGVRALLIAIARHYPRPYPSQATLAKETGYDARSIRRYVAKAQEAGLLQVRPDEGRRGKNNNWSKTNRYLINPALIEANLSSTGEDRLSSKPYGLRPSGIELRSTPSDEGESLSVNAARLDPSDRERQVGEPPSPPRPEKRRRQPTVDEILPAGANRRQQPRKSKPVRVIPWAVATEHFCRTWQEMIETLPANDRLRQVRPVETRGHCRSYFDSTFFGPKATTPKTTAEVCELIDQFVALALRGMIRFKPDQSAWMAFTGAWGRKADRYHNEQYTTRNYKLPENQ